MFYLFMRKDHLPAYLKIHPHLKVNKKVQNIRYFVDEEYLAGFILFAITAAGAVLCGGPKNIPVHHP